MSLSIRFLWAKPGSSSSTGWHPLLLHLLDVAACADAILELEPESTRIRMGQVLGLPWLEARPWLLFVIACHDLGKACPGFQKKWPELLERTGLPMPRGANTSVRHDYVSQVELERILAEDSHWPEELACLVADAVGCHHGARASDRERGDALLAACAGNASVAEQWRVARREITDLLKAVFRPGAPPEKAKLDGADFMLLAGLTSFADWIGSNTEYFTFGSDSACSDPLAWFTHRRSVAMSALARIGWLPRTPLSTGQQTFEDVFRQAPRPLQREVADILQDLDEPAVLLVEAPMGEGKTEAALFAHLELQRKCGHRGLYLALPTKATGNAMFTRVKKFLGEHDPGRVLDLQLLHGAQWLNEEFQSLRIEKVDDPEGQGAVRAAEWFTNKKRALLSEYGVGTLDQALVTILPVRHNFVRIWGLANRVVVLDEIHAYDAYTGTLLQHLVTWLRAMGSSVVMLSATLSPSIRKGIAKAAGAKLPDEEPQYPRVTVIRSNGEASQRHAPADPARRLALQLQPLGIGLADIRQALEASLPRGGTGLALVNTVQRAQDLYRAFPEGQPLHDGDVQIGKQVADTKILLFHARFPAAERERREAAALRLFGRDSERSGRCILIATQVAEQSLDLDFDVMASDLAPIDLLLQRAGRLWRHARPARQVTGPVLFVAGLSGESPPSFLRPLWWGKVYREDLLLRTWSLLRERNQIVLPDDIDPMVTAVYEDAVLLSDELQRRHDTAQAAAEGVLAAERIQAHMAITGLPHDGSWNNPSAFVLYDEDENGVHRTLMARTRLGQDSVVAIPVANDEEIPENVVSVSDARRRFLRAVSVSRPDVTKKLRERGVPKSWQATPLLRNTIPMKLDAAGRWVEMPTVRLDAELGLVYEPREVQ